VSGNERKGCMIDWLSNYQRWAMFLISDFTPTPKNSTPTPVRLRKFF